MRKTCYRSRRVIQNRLSPSNKETFGLLQMDSTAQYGYGEMHDGTVSSSGEALADHNPWNTYVNTGLPIGPISNPGDVRDRRGDAPRGRRLALLRHSQPRHRRDRVHDEPRRPQPRRRAVAGLVQRPPRLGMLTPAGTRLEVWGDPVAHSRSPQLHTAAYRVLGLDWSYERRQVAESAFDAELAGLVEPRGADSR